MTSSPTTDAMISLFQRVVSTVGYLTIGFVTYKAVNVVLYNLHTSKLQRYLHPHPHSYCSRRESAGENDDCGSSDTDAVVPVAWGLVTGASSGIGLVWVHELAARNFGVILHGRDQVKLNGIIAGLEERYDSQPNVRFRSLVMDAQNAVGPKFDAAILAAVSGLNVTVVIHNVGGQASGQRIMVLQEYISAAEIEGWVNVNARFAMHLTRLLLPLMLQSQPGLMIYVSSGITRMTVPKLAPYSGQKACMEQYMRVLNTEMQIFGHDIEVKALVTGTVVTSTSGRTEKDRSFLMPLAEDFVTSAFDKIGWGDVVITPWIGHQVQFALIHLLPAWAYRRLVASMLEKTRAGFEDIKKEN